MKNSAAKGLAFEREIANLAAESGFAVRGLENTGDHIIIVRDGLVLSSECKRQERLRIPEWWAQTLRDTPAGAVPVLTFRQSRAEPLSLVRTVDLFRLVARP